MADVSALSLILDALPAGTCTPEMMGHYTAAVASIRGLRITEEPWVRKEKKTKREVKDGCVAYEGGFVRDGGIGDPKFKTGVLVREIRGREFHKRKDASGRKKAHIEEATGCEFPSLAERAGLKSSPQLREAAKASLQWGRHGTQLRRERCSILKGCAESLRQLSAAILGAPGRDPQIIQLTMGLNIGFQCAIVDAIYWPDKFFPFRMTFGFPIVGVIPDSGVFRHLGKTKEELDDFRSTWPEAMSVSSNVQWMRELESKVKDAGELAQQSETGRARALLLQQRCDDEVLKKYSTGPFTSQELDNRFGRGGWRAARRTFIEQGVDENGEVKLRMIDNEKTSGHNERSFLMEMISPDGAGAPVAIAKDYVECVGENERAPELVLSLDDVEAAYRIIPNSQLRYAVVCIWTPEGPRYYVMSGHSFGLTSAVTNFNRMPALLCAAAQVLLACTVNHFFDDFQEVSMAMCKSSVQDSMWA
mmetsp:Transcript_31715/g.80714  ORF Transcript_31715/g.80714 Transcript_31715/m.80714 type:complete len:476 (-) Transcript_31715:973-2400(-)